MNQKRVLKLNLFSQSDFPCNTTDRRVRGGGAEASHAAASNTGAGILASLSCTGRKYFIDCYSSSYTPPSSEKSSKVLISSW
jgi:hypothetical protein